MVFYFFRNKPLRGFAYSAAGGVGLLASQMYWVHYKFRLPSEARGPLSGVVEAPAKPAARWWHGSPALAWWRASPALAARAARRNIVFLGDSLVTGVGCSAEASERRGPVLPRRVAEVLAQQLGEDVGWMCLGETGAGVSKLRSELLPSLQREVQRASRAGERIDAVVVMTGLNDIKECFLWMQPSNHPLHFRAGLEQLCASVREMAGAQCKLLIPATPMHIAPRFADLWPLSAAVRGVTWMWESQKRALADEASRELGGGAGGPGGGEAPSAADRDAVGAVGFLEAPPTLAERSMYAADGMHPNDAGYAVWAELIAQKLARQLRPHAGGGGGGA